MQQAEAVPGQESPVARAVEHHLRGELDAAEALYRRALEGAPEDATLLNNLGFLLAQRGRPDEAVEHYERALAADPARSSPHANLALVYAGRGELRAGSAARARS